MVSPNIIMPLLIIGAIIGSLGYSYFVGREQGKVICEADRLQQELIVKQAELKAKQQEVKNLKELNDYGTQLVGEAQKEADDERTKNEQLQKIINELSSTNTNDDYVCVPDSVLTELRKRRSPVYKPES